MTGTLDPEVAPNVLEQPPGTVIRPVSMAHMWQRFKNIFSSIGSYAELSPDIQTRRQVQHWLCNRAALPLEAWFTTVWEPQGVCWPLAEFLDQHLTAATGLEFTRLQPSDRLIEDLKLPLICWFDWEITLCESFFKHFGIDLSDRLPTDLQTVQDLVLFFQEKLTPTKRDEASPLKQSP